ncbi:MAG: hypothetical protein DRJ10_19765 [Bacteroidetes bacterium]|nr:MAG: hypothetical protein DRJ10_19765 [Bacteroidota bacterium]
MILKKLSIIIFVLILSNNSFAQNLNLAAYHNYLKHFIIFDSGEIHDVENTPVQSFQVGGNCIAYISSAGQLKVYYKGETQILSQQMVSDYFTTRNLLVYRLFDQLYVFDNGKQKLLSSNVQSFAVGDSIVAFFNPNRKSSHVYYKEKIYNLENSLVGDPIKDFKVSDNIFAYFNNNSKYFKVFYNGQLEEINQSNDLINFKPGRNLVAYEDNSTNTFHVFYKGEIIDLEDFKPKSFKVGDDLLAYIDALEEFKVFADGEVKVLSEFEPDAYYVTDSLVVYIEQGYLKVYYNGQIYELENFVPEDFQIQERTIAYIDLNGWLKAFSAGKHFTVTKDLVKSFKLTYNTILINTTVNTVKIYYEGALKDTN